jgi:hypothetical protein
MTHLGNIICFDRERIRKMQRELEEKNANGFKLTIPNHCVSSNYECSFKKFGYSRRKSRLINPFRLGYANKFVKTHFNFPYECILITEAQKYLNSRMSMYFPEWQSRWYEQHGHNSLDIFLDTQRPLLIDVNIRELASFIEVISLDVKYDKFGRVKKMIWLVRKIENSSLFDIYMGSGRKDKDCYKEEKIVADYDVFDCYSSQNCKPKFYAGHMDDDFDLKYSAPSGETKEDYISYLERVDDELPKGFYQRRKTNE